MTKVNKLIVYLFLTIAITLLIGIPIIRAISTPTDPKWDSWSEYHPEGNNWGQEFIELPSAWDISTGSSKIKIGIVDGGFDSKHEDLIQSVTYINPMNFLQSHGTHVAGIIGAKAENNIGISGIFWDSNLELYSIAVPDAKNKYKYDMFIILTSIKTAVIHGVKIINFSIGAEANTIEQAQFLNDSWESGLFSWLENAGYDLLFIFATGNKHYSVKNVSPASLSEEYNNVISVAAIDENGDLADEANWGSNYGNVTVAAPGVDIYSTLPNNQYDNMSGTSMAAPFVSGLAGLIYSRAEELGRTLSAAEVKQLIIDGAVKGGKYAEGPDGIKIPIINAYESLKLLEPASCGDGIINGTEQCDGIEFGGATCQSVMGTTYTGSLSCASNCNYDTSECYEVQVNEKAPFSTFGYDGARSGQSIYNGPISNNIKWTYTATSTWGSSFFGIVPVVTQNGSIIVANETEGKLYAFNSNGTIKWTFLDNGASLGPHLSAPIVANDGTIYIGSSKGILFAINPDGTEKWHYILDTGHWVGTPVIDENGNIYFTSTYPSVDNKSNYLYSIATDGTENWKYQIENFAGIAHTAIGPDGTIYSSTVYTYSYNDLLYAVLPNGNLKWKKFYRPGTSPVVGPDGTIYFKNVYTGLEAVNPDDGSLKWFKRIYPNLKVSVSKNNIIIADDSTGIYAINSDGTEKWKNDQIGSVYNSSATIGNDGTVYIATNLGLFALDINDGSIKWKIDGISATSPAIAEDGTLYVGWNYNIYAIGK